MEMLCAFEENSRPLTDMDTESCQYPDIAAAGDRVLACWQRYKNGQDTVVLCDITGKTAGEPTVISGSGQAFTPSFFRCGGETFVLWNEFCEDSWKLFARPCGEKGGEPVLIAAARGIFFPQAAPWGDGACIVWGELSDDASRISLCSFDGTRAGAPVTVSKGDRCFRPSVTVCGDDVYCLFDAFEDGQYRVKSVVYSGGKTGPESVLSEGSEWASAPKIAATSTGITAVWYAVAPRADIDYWTAELVCEGGRLTAATRRKVARIRDWFACVELASSGDRDIFIHSKSYHALIARTRTPEGGAWSNSAVIYSDAQLCAGIRPRALFREDGQVWIIYQTANGNGHRERNAAITLFCAPFAALEAQDDGYVDALQNNFTRPIETEKELLSPAPDVKAAWLGRNLPGLDVIFGDIHGQSDMSDGTGQVDMYYQYAKTVAGLDFSALTDHDCFTDIITPAEWAYMRTLCNFYNRDGDLTTLVSYEWTPNELRYDFGHKNVYFPGDEGEIFRVCDPGGLTPDRLFASIKPYGAIAVPHHPSATWGMVSAATDWDFHDPDVQRLGEIFSRHAPFEKDGTTSIYTKNNPRLKGKYIQDALARGYRIGFTAGSDSHQLEHGLEGGIVAALVPRHDRSSVFDALYNRHVYGTTGARILLGFAINGARMGDEITVASGEEVLLEIDVVGTALLRSVEIVRNNEDVVSAPCVGNTCRFSWREDGVENAYYYIRVTQEDEQMAWSSPIWVDIS